MAKSGKRRQYRKVQNMQEQTEMKEIHRRLVEIFREVLEDEQAGNTVQITAISRLANALKQSGIFPLKNETTKSESFDRAEIINEINKILCGEEPEENDE